MIIYLLTVASILTIVHVSIRYSEFGRSINKIPGFWTLPFVGDVLYFACPADKIWNVLRYLWNEYYPISKVWSVNSAVVLARHPDDVKAILTCKKNINKANIAYGHIHQCYGYDGLIVSTERLWNRRRKILNQAFTPYLLELYSETVVNLAKNFVDELRGEGDVIVKNITEEFMKFSLKAVCGATMGFDLDTDPELGNNYRKAFAEFSQIISYRIFHPYFPDWFFKLLPIGRRQSTIQKMNEDFVTKMINERRKYHESLKKNVMNDYVDDLNKGLIIEDVKGEKKKLAVLDLLLLAEKKGLIDAHGILSEVTHVTVAGFETTGMSIGFFLMLLAENKEAQDLARTELREIVGEDETITPEHIQQLDYLDRCMKESLRLFPTAPHIGRIVTEEITLSNYKVPVGADVFISIYDLHRDPNFWPEPEKFDPDRFLPDNVAERHPFAYVPFSSGLRSCIGQKLAITELKTIAAYIIRDFYLEPVDLTSKLTFELKITLYVENVRLKFVKIKN